MHPGIGMGAEALLMTLDGDLMLHRRGKAARLQMAPAGAKPRGPCGWAAALSRELCGPIRHVAPAPVAGGG